ncbi:hypothetical protein BDL97_04G110500 [Sphagnum fallax]|nr:hypothetical protein BDL97_04G110500 [Sphagnum fallax]
MHVQSRKQQIELVVTQENDFDKEAERRSKSLLFFQGVHTLLTIAITLLTIYLCICFLTSVPRITTARYDTPANGSGQGEEEEKDSDFSHAKLFARASSSLLGLISRGVVIVAGMWMSDVGLWKPPEEAVGCSHCVDVGAESHNKCSKLIRKCFKQSGLNSSSWLTFSITSEVVLLDDGTTLVSRLILDVMGNSSPIIRRGQRPDGVCLVVGTCARGFENNSTSDLIYTRTPVTQVGSNKTQYFWKAFPVGSGPRDMTMYMFTYLDATPNRPSLEQMLEDYWDLMPPYQGIKLEDVEILWVLFGLFPTYQSSPLPPAFDQILQVGDVSGIQSPISFGGFVAITRHLSRLSNGLMDALESDLLDKENLALLNPYLPNLSGVWMFQRAMSVRLDIDPFPDFINNLVSINFQCME